MLPKKRSWRSFAPDADSLLAIRLAEEGGAPLAADRFMLLAVSECARDLPSDAASWDLSGLLVDGQPLRREVVLAWLHVLSQLMQSQPFSEPQQEPPLATSATGLAQLLSFADAVGSSDSVLKACLPPELEQLRFRVAAGGEHEVQLQAGGAYVWGSDEPLQLCKRQADLTTKTQWPHCPARRPRQRWRSSLPASWRRCCTWRTGWSWTAWRRSCTAACATTQHGATLYCSHLTLSLTRVSCRRACWRQRLRSRQHMHSLPRRQLAMSEA